VIPATLFARTGWANMSRVPRQNSGCSASIAPGKLSARVRARSIDRANKISAKIDEGVVTLTLPKAEHVKPRKINVS
jgi:HSP20 family molecular chaperone IbpA